MEIIDPKPENENNQSNDVWKNYEESHKRGKIFGGILLVIAGSLFLARELGTELPHWLFSWKMIIIAVGLLVGFKHNFRKPSWFILILIGTIFLLSDLYPGMVDKFLLWPIVLIIIGLVVIFKPRNKRHDKWKKKWEKYKRYDTQNHCSESSNTNDGFIDSVTFMGSISKNIVTKDFKGAEITVVFGGTEINLSQADFVERASIEITQVFGGTQLIIPSNWEIKSELVSVFGSIEDKRAIPNLSNETKKTLMIRGTSVFGGIEIKSYK